MSQKNVRPTRCTHFFDPQLDEFRGSLDPHERKRAGRTHEPLDVAYAKFGITISYDITLLNDEPLLFVFLFLLLFLFLFLFLASKGLPRGIEGPSMGHRWAFKTSKIIFQ